MSRPLELKAYAKVNLGLDVVRRREDGYHEVRMVMQTVKLFDLLTLQKNEGGEIHMTTNLPYLPTNEKNLVYRAIDLIRAGSLSMTEISARCGFDTIRNFNRVFRQITGFAPRELPDSYVLNLRSNSGNTGFDPTLAASELMS